MLKRRCVWLWLAWPIWVLMAVMGSYAALVWALPVPMTMVNKITGAILQVVGGIMVLHSVNGNLGLFRGETLLSAITSWLQAYPRTKPAVSLSGSATSKTSASAAGLVSVRPLATTTAARLSELECFVAHLQTTITHHRALAIDGIAEVRTEMQIAAAGNHESLRELASRTESATVGGFKMQLFGVGLVILGAIVDVFA